MCVVCNFVCGPPCTDHVLCEIIILVPWISIFCASNIFVLIRSVSNPISVLVKVSP